MHVKLRENRIRIRLIFLLAVQTVCLIAAPSQAHVLQNLRVIPVCVQTEEVTDVQTADSVQHRQRQSRFGMLLFCMAAAGIAAYPLLLPAVQTPVRCRVRMNN